MSNPFDDETLFDLPTDSETHATVEACPFCRGEGALDVTPFRWQSTRLLQWRCRRCRNAWIMPERRALDRSA
jgi:hypothetical protein